MQGSYVLYKSQVKKDGPDYFCDNDSYSWSVISWWMVDLTKDENQI